MAVPVERNVRSDRVADPAHEVGHGVRRGDPERVDDDHLGRARGKRAQVRLLEERKVRARAVDAEERDPDARFSSERHRPLDPLEHLLARDAERLQLEVGEGRLDHGGMEAEVDDRLHVVRHGPREAPQLGVQPCAGDQLDRATVVLGHAREPDLDPVDAEFVEQLRDLELLLRPQHDTDRLLAVTKRRVVQADAPRLEQAERLLVQGPRPDLRTVDQAGTSSHETRGGGGSPWASCHETTGLRSTPIRSISASIRSPGFR